MQKIIGVVAALLFIAIVMSMAFVIMNKLQSESDKQQDAAQMLQVHEGLLYGSDAHFGRLPAPSIAFEGADGDGRSAEYNVHNSTANLYSYLVGQNLVDTKDLVSPSEPNPFVKSMDSYNFSVVNASQGQHWDPAFVADLETGSNVSYAHTPLFGQRLLVHWRSDADPNTVILSNRGVESGNDWELDVYSKSLTLKIHGPDDAWEGWCLKADGSNLYVTSFEPEGITTRYHSQTIPDNLFRVDHDDRYSSEHSNDIFMTFTKSIGLNELELWHVGEYQFD